MNKTTILFAGFPETDKGLFDAFDGNWICSFADNPETAIEKFQQLHQDVVVLAKTLGETDAKKLEQLFTKQHPGLVVLSEQDTDLSPGNVLQALVQKQKENKPSISINDDVLKNAGLNIQIQ